MLLVYVGMGAPGRSYIAVAVTVRRRTDESLHVPCKLATTKRSRAINIRYFFLTDQVEKGNMSIEYCPTDMMWADYMTKPLQGEKFRKFRDDILGYN